MKANHIPVTERLRNRICKLGVRLEGAHIKSPNKGNPYWCCAECGIHDPSLYVEGGRHHHGCPIQGLDKQIEYYKRLLSEALESKI